jgi:hypothetical protein
VAPQAPGAVQHEVGEATLRLLVERLHPAVLDLVATPAGLDVPITDVVILDQTEPAPPGAGTVVLAVGVEEETARVELVQRLGRAAVAAVVFRGAATGSAAAEAAAASGVALLAAPAQLSWGQLFGLLQTASTTAPGAAELPGPPLGDLFALANAVAAMIGGATTIEDPQSRVLAYSTLGHPIDLPRRETILGRQVPSDWLARLHEAGVFRRLWQTDEVVHVDHTITDEPSYINRIAIAVRAGGELLGSIWVIEADQALGAEAERALREAAGIAALHLLRHRTAQDVDRRRRSDALLAALEGQEVGAAARALLGLDRARTATVVAFDAGGGHDAEALMRAHRVADLIAVYCESYRRQATCAVSGTRVYALVPGDTDGSVEPVRGLAQAIVDRAARALHTPVRAGIGSPGAAGEPIAGSRREADQVLDALPVDRAVAAIDEVRPQVLLHRLRELAATDPQLRAGRLDALAEQDATKGTAWIPTLRAYFDAFGDMAGASARVSVHPNTFRYRLRRITEVFGLDLDDPDERLALELQLRFLETGG